MWSYRRFNRNKDRDERKRSYLKIENKHTLVRLRELLYKDMIRNGEELADLLIENKVVKGDYKEKVEVYKVQCKKIINEKIEHSPDMFRL